jgi:CspA family cold shock protein
VFVHISAVQKAGMDSLNEGQKVSFDVLTERGKPAAGNIRSA